MSWMIWGLNHGGPGFLHPSRPALGSTQPSIRVGTSSFPGVRQLVHGTDHRPPSSTEVKERAELYLYSPSRLLWPVLVWTLPLPLPTSKHTKTQENLVKKWTQRVLRTKWIIFRYPWKHTWIQTPFLLGWQTQNVSKWLVILQESFCIYSINEQCNLYIAYIWVQRIIKLWT